MRLFCATVKHTVMANALQIDKNKPNMLCAFVFAPIGVYAQRIMPNGENVLF